MRKGLIFDIERFSTKDGPGCRTVVFFKGCNMHCSWCHNPESICPHPQLSYDPNSCVACGKCAQVCPVGAHIVTEESHLFAPEQCRHCLSCASACFSGALQRVGKTMTAEEVIAEIEQDTLLYQKSGGGVTLSGGEVMMQVDFAYELLKKCREQGISACIETNLSAPWENYEKMLPLLDILFADIKHADDGAHRKWTGISNQRILQNLERLKATGKPFVIRTPVIPGVNGRDEDILDIVQKLSGSSSLQYYEMLTYNPLGESKGKLVDEAPIYSTRFEIPSRETMQRLAKIAAGVVPTKLDGRWVS